METKKPESHVSGPVVKTGAVDKKSLQQKVGVSSGKAVGKYVLGSVILPSLKELLYNIIWKGTKEWLFPGSKGAPSEKSKTDSILSQVVSYRKYQNASTTTEQGVPSTSDGSVSRDVILSDKNDATDLYNTVADVIERYKVITVAEFYELAGHPINSTDNNYGWTSMGGMSIVEMSDGRYWFKTPKAFPLDKN